MNQLHAILRLIILLLVMLGVLAASLATTCNAAALKQTASCCTGDTCDPAALSPAADSAKAPAHPSSKSPCTDCTILCKTLERSMVPFQTALVDLSSPDAITFIDTSPVIPASEHLSGVFKPPKA